MALSVLAFYNGLTEAAKGHRYLTQFGALLNYSAFFQIAIQPNGSLKGVPSRVLIHEAHTMRLKVLPVITNLSANGQFSDSVMKKLLYDQAFADRVWQNIFELLTRYQCDGVNLDLEHPDAKDRQRFTQLIQNWAARFRGEHFLVSIDIPAKASDEPEAEWKGAFDYKALEKCVDFVVLMTYPEHGPGSSPGSVASVSWVNKILDYALTQIPAQKVYLGIPLYGYDWPSQGSGQVIPFNRAMELAQRYGAAFLWDPNQHSTYFNYEAERNRHTVYFENPRSLTEKVNIAKTRNLKGIALWEMNLSYPEFWDTLQKNLQ